MENKISSTNQKKDRDGARSEIRAPFVIKTRKGPRTEAERTTWVRMGGLSPSDFCTNPAFGQDSFLSDYIPGDDVYDYCCGCTGLMERARKWHLPLGKRGLSQQPSLMTRRNDLRGDRYGSFCHDGESYVEEPGFIDYELQRSQLLFEPHPRSPVALVDRGLRYRLPQSYAVRDFDRDMKQVILTSSLHHFARSPAGLRHFGLLDLTPDVARRFTRYGFGSEERFSLADEIYVMRPREDCSRLAIIAERLILAHVLSITAGKTHLHQRTI